MDSCNLPLACLDLASSAASIQLLREVLSPSDGALLAPERPPEDPSTALVLAGPPAGGQLGLDFGLSLGVGLEERLGLDHKIARTFVEVEERVNRRVRRLKAELQRREAELEQERQGRERLRTEKQKVEERAAHLSRQVG